MFWKRFGKKRRQRLETLQLTSLLSRWCQVRENLLYAFERCLDSPLSSPLKQAIRDLLTRIRGGMPPDDALALLAQYSSAEHFQDLIFALRFNFRHRGNLPALMELLEVQQNKLEEAYHDRQISNQSDLRIVLSLLCFIPLLFGWRLLSNREIQSLLLEPGPGLALSIAGVCCYLAALLWFIQLDRQVRT